MSNDKVENQLRDYYDKKGWVADSEGRLTENILFRDVRGGKGVYEEKIASQPRNLFDGRSGTLLIVGGGDLPDSHIRAADLFEKVICIDISERALELSKNKLSNKGKYYNASVLDIPLSDNTVDAVLCAHMLYHVDRANQDRAVREMIRVTKQGGRVLIIYSNPEAPLMLIQRFLKVLHINKLLGKAYLYVYNYPLRWWESFNKDCAVTILPNDAISANQVKVLFPTVALRKKFYKWASNFEDIHTDWAAKLWSYVTIVLDKRLT